MLVAKYKWVNLQSGYTGTSTAEVVWTKSQEATFPRMVKSWKIKNKKRHWGQSESKHHSLVQVFHIRPQCVCVEGGNLQITLPLTHPEPHRPFPDFPTALNTIKLWLFASFPKSLQDSLEMPQQHTYWGQQSVDLSPSSGRQLKKFWLTSNPFLPAHFCFSRQVFRGGGWKLVDMPPYKECSVFTFHPTLELMCFVFLLVLTSSRNLKCELHKKFELQRHHIRVNLEMCPAGLCRSTQADRMLTCHCTPPPMCQAKNYSQLRIAAKIKVIQNLQFTPELNHLPACGKTKSPEADKKTTHKICGSANCWSHSLYRSGYLFVCLCYGHCDSLNGYDLCSGRGANSVKWL